jgi:hypothetical protein
MVTMARKNPGGRPPRIAGEETVLVALRVTGAERDIYRAEAEAANQSMSDWIRAACEGAMSRRHRRTLRAQGKDT